MGKIQKQDTTLSLRGKNIYELRDLALRYIRKPLEEIISLDRQSLISLLSRTASSNLALSRQLKKFTVYIKPSFYLMVVSLKSQKLPSMKLANVQLKDAAQRVNKTIAGNTATPNNKDFQVENLTKRSENVFEFTFTWNRIHW